MRQDFDISLLGGHYQITRAETFGTLRLKAFSLTLQLLNYLEASENI